MASIDQTINEIADEFALLPDWEERISYVIELGRGLAPLTDAERNEATRVRGCASQVWLVSDTPSGRARKSCIFAAIPMRIWCAARSPCCCASSPAERPRRSYRSNRSAVFDRLGLKDALTTQRSNGLFSMMSRIQAGREGGV